VLPGHVLTGIPSSEERVAVLAATALRTKDGVRLTVLGRSMMPVLWPGATVEIERCEEGALGRGEIALCRVGGGVRLHRVRRIDDGAVVTQGDGCPSPDPEAGEVIGRTRGLCVGRWQWAGCPAPIVRAVRAALVPALPWVRSAYRAGLFATWPLRGLRRAVARTGAGSERTVLRSDAWKRRSRPSTAQPT
jgi:hypothetical protein